MSTIIPDYNPSPIVPQNIDPRFRYGFRARPRTYPEATSRFYLPLQRDNRFYPLVYKTDNDKNVCHNALQTLNPPQCHVREDCVPFMERHCNDGQIRFISYSCEKKSPGDKLGICRYESDVNI